MFNRYFRQIISEINATLDKIADRQVEECIVNIQNARNIILVGAGRMGLACHAFSMRLNHLGYKAFFYHDSNIPFLDNKDLLIVASGSGETESISKLLAIGKKINIKTQLITCNPTSTMAKMADTTLVFHGLTKTNKDKNITTQPMTTINEQSIWILFDILSLIIRDRTTQTNRDMADRHNNLE